MVMMPALRADEVCCADCQRPVRHAAALKEPRTGGVSVPVCPDRDACAAAVARMRYANLIEMLGVTGGLRIAYKGLSLKRPKPLLVH